MRQLRFCIIESLFIHIKYNKPFVRGNSACVGNVGSLVGIRHPFKAAIVEKFNRKLKEKMWRYFTYKNSRRYIDDLQDLVT